MGSSDIPGLDSWPLTPRRAVRDHNPARQLQLDPSSGVFDRDQCLAISISGWASRPCLCCVARPPPALFATKRSCRIHVAVAIVVLREGANKERVMAKKKKKNSKSKT